MTTSAFLQRLSAGPLVGDGAMGTELQRAGLAIGECGDHWVLTSPDPVLAIHAAYLDAGSEAVTTNSFGANRWALGRYGLDGEVARVNEAAARLARRAAGSTAFVLGDIGPCGELLQPLGPVTPDELLAQFTLQAEALLRGGADAILIETMTAVEELELAVRGARLAGAPVVIASLAFDKLPNGQVRTMMGVSPEQAARAAVGAGADAIGANCGTRMALGDFALVVSRFRECCQLPVMIQANAGSPELVEGRAAYRLAPDDFAEGMTPLLEAGVQVVGGCCGTTPAHIAALAGRVRRAAGRP